MRKRLFLSVLVLTLATASTAPAAPATDAIDPANPDVVWVGTGEGNPRNSVSVGNGVYRTRDGGRT